MMFNGARTKDWTQLAFQKKDCRLAAVVSIGTSIMVILQIVLLRTDKEK